MEKVYIIMTWMLCILFAACSDNDNNAGVPSLKVVSSDVSFDCKGGTGSIRMEASSTITAESTEEWCQVAVADQAVNITVPVNKLIGSRSAMVLIRAGKEETRVPVYQMGDIFDTDLKNTDVTADGGEMEFHVKSIWDVEFEGVDDTWITYTYSAKDERMTIKAAPLTEGGKYRADTIRVKADTHEISVIFRQANMAGKYSCFSDGGSNAYGTCLIEKTDTAFLYKVTPTGSTYDAPYYAKCRGGEFVIYFGQYLGKYNNNNYPRIYLCAHDNNPIDHSPLPSIEYVAPLDAVYSDGQMLLTFKDNGTWRGHKVDGFFYGAFSDFLEKGGKLKAGFSPILNLVWLKVKEP